MIQQLFVSGRIADLILAIVAVEFCVLAWMGRGPRFASLALDRFLALAPGACLLLALRVALTGGGWVWVAAWVTASLPFHVGDVLRRRR